MASNPDFTSPQCKRESFVWRSERRSSFHSYPSKQAAEICQSQQRRLDSNFLTLASYMSYA